MLKKTITFKDLDGNDVTEDFYFNLSKAEVTKMELSYPGGLAEHLKKVLENQNGAEIITTFERFITESYGKRSEDGRRFIKNPDVLAEFVDTDAYSEMFMELCTDAGAGADFVRGIMPGGENLDLSEVLPEVPAPAVATQTVELPPVNVLPAWVTENRDPTSQEFQKMTPAQMQEAFAAKELRLKNG